jgi:AcrR family transcriptional regulator
MKRKTLPALDLGAVIDRALAIADSEGLASVSMRRLASEFGVTPMALYHHVENKEQLLDLMADASLQAIPPIDPRAPWDEEVHRFFTAFHRLFVEHPAVAFVMTERPLEGPTATRLGDQLLGLLKSAGFDDDDAVATVVALVNYTIGASLYRLSRGRPQRSRLAGLRADTAPTAFRLRDKLAAAASERQFAESLTRIIDAHRPR